MDKIICQVIITNKSSYRLQNLYKQLDKLRVSFPDLKILIRKFEACPDYKGSTMENDCVKKSIFQNHKNCCKYLLSSKYKFTLVLEDDVVLQPNYESMFIKCVEWMMNNYSRWDIFYGGCMPILKFDDNYTDTFVRRVAAVHNHCVFYNRDFSQKFINIPYEDVKNNPLSATQFDGYLCVKEALGQVKGYYCTKPLALQSDDNHKNQELGGYKYSVNLDHVCIFFIILFFIVFILIFKI